MQGSLSPDVVRLLARVGGRRMGDEGLPLALSRATAALATRGARNALRGEAEAVAAIEWRAFNAPRDRDDAGLLGARRRASGAQDAAAFHPLLEHRDGRAWLRMGLEASLAAGASHRRGIASADAASGHEARLLSYRWHDDDTPCAEAIRQDLVRFADVRDIAAVCAMGVDDACALQREGRLATTLSVAWDALLAEALPALADATGDAPALLLEVAAGAQATLAVALHDRVTVAIARRTARGARAFRVQLRRQRGDDRSLALDAGIEAGFADPEAAARVLQGALAHVLGAPAEALAAIRHATSLRRVPARHRALVGALAERLRLRDNAPFEALKARLAELDARLAGRVEAVLRERIAVAIDAEYRRLATDALLLEVELSEAALRRLHPALLALDTAAVLADPGVSRETLSLLHDRAIARWQAFGIEASLGSWFEFASRQAREDRRVTRRRIDADGDRTRREYTAATRYTARANGWSTAYGATVEALDDGDGAGTRCAVALWWEEGRLRADAAGLARLVDDAVLWGAVAPGRADVLLAHLREALAGADRCRPRLEFALDPADAARVVGALARAGVRDWARHAARALPHNPREPARRDCAAREAAYAAALAGLAEARGTALRNGIAAAVAPVSPRLGARERAGQVPWTAWQVLHRSGLAARGPGAAWRAWSAAAVSLDALLAARRNAAPIDPAQWRVLATAVDALRPAFEQPYTLRTLASLLGAALPGAARLAIAHGRDGHERTLLVQAPARTGP